MKALAPAVAEGGAEHSSPDCASCALTVEKLLPQQCCDACWNPRVATQGVNKTCNAFGSGDRTNPTFKEAGSDLSCPLGGGTQATSWQQMQMEEAGFLTALLSDPVQLGNWGETHTVQLLASPLPFPAASVWIHVNSMLRVFAFAALWIVAVLASCVWFFYTLHLKDPDFLNTRSLVFWI